ncbi:MAG: hypothetical protein COY75_03875 [Nitrospirae bacterium CG_4_10_14_0_8_um_filter_41_23]|nr:MAG: hypothetical protein COV68_10880 [Nitrospirae bacterium CG11_big_fil_rev_8_21_14_0_20_41_14]PIW87633.1 MAG: hypothetical protein COZ94_03975 [Nitrospirae bacterium CG_4_8_14_3_um_filter_41_47]PIY87229.1 MAG: hypothetical protein COY75_03875 [Nitrospirae bacterium CG_4_10_14_0_8_um_filter_41_23]PJA80896.1 MAG: hypothetical protein CO148_01385 [Nitrospirae bacterium CG_4_9_14_3_um_filter_41_27]
MSEKKYDFVQFEGVGSKLSSYTISISRSGAFGINSGFYNAESIKNYSHVIVFYDKAKKVIGLVFTKTPSKKSSFKITHGKNSAYIGARSFFASIIAGDKDALTKYADKYTPQTYNDDKIGKMFYIDLKEKEENE